ncbi:class I SAM-dependent methyltransferase [Nonomuraea sp. AD125B]|uniref:class I SAM-dependent methyltransferase n=1 Tax=Nonomuraea sp. AD125B TaxID=3242897 RepID=UPI003526D5E0
MTASTVTGTGVPATQAGYFQLRAELLGPSRTRLLTGPELIQVGLQVYGAPAAFSLYGVPAPEMAGCGLRLLGRTAIECTVDAYAAPVAAALAERVPAAGRPPLVADLFCGSGNLGRHLAAALGVRAHASELDPAVHAATRHNLTALGIDIDLRLEDYRDLLGRLTPHGPHDTYVVEPPWGPAFTEQGLDLTATAPPVPEILADITASRQGAPCLIVIKTNDRIAHDSLQRCFAAAEHLASITPAPTLPAGANMDFHLFRLSA